MLLIFKTNKYWKGYEERDRVLDDDDTPQSTSDESATYTTLNELDFEQQGKSMVNISPICKQLTPYRGLT
jgi:hypothetical protein